MIVLANLATTPQSSPPVDPKRLRATVEKLASFPTRNTNTQGLTDACNWIADEFRSVPGLQVELMSYHVEAGRRIPKAKDVVQVVATLPGATDRKIVVGGHIDTINMAEGATLDSRAPGANDDASGVALTLELARICATRKWNQTLVFVAFSGEEQGLLGSTALAKRAKAEDWHIDAVLSSDTVGSSSNLAGQKHTKQVRVFSEEGEGHNSRDQARYIEWAARQDVKGFGVKLVFRRDRFGRGGDHTPFVAQGFDAVRFVEVHEEYSRQHTLDDLPVAMDWTYLANVARVNLAAISRLANAPSPPLEVRVVRDQGHDTHLTWKAAPGIKYEVFWRETTSPTWQGHQAVGTDSKATIKLVNKDDHVFAVGAVGGVPVEAK